MTSRSLDKLSLENIVEAGDTGPELVYQMLVHNPINISKKFFFLKKEQWMESIITVYRSD